MTDLELCAPEARTPLALRVTSTPKLTAYNVTVTYGDLTYLSDFLAETVLPPQEIAPPPHEHSWFEGCRKDQYGLTVLDCACGARKRVRHGMTGVEEVSVQKPTSPLGDVLFDVSTLDTGDLRERRALGWAT